MTAEQPKRPVGRPPKIIPPIPALLREVIQSLVKPTPRKPR